MDKGKILTNIQQRLAENDYRLTPQREAVVQVLLQDQNEHLGAENIHLKTKEFYPEIGLATVYRTLEMLERLGIIYKLEYGDGQSRYELNIRPDAHYHHHLICLTCGKISEFNDDLLDEIEQRISRETGFKVSDHCLRFFGYCTDCQNRK